MLCAKILRNVYNLNSLKETYKCISLNRPSNFIHDNSKNLFKSCIISRSMVNYERKSKNHVNDYFRALICWKYLRLIKNAIRGNFLSFYATYNIAK